MKEKLINRISSNSGDTNSTSMILWIALVAVAVLSIGTLLVRALNHQSHNVANMIEGAGVAGEGADNFWVNTDNIIPDTPPTP